MADETIAPAEDVEKPVLDVEKDVITQIPDIEVAPTPAELKPNFDVAAWTPKTRLGQRVKSGEITTIVQALRSGERIMEAQIVDILMPNVESDMLWIGQSRGKFGGGQRRLFKQTQKKTPEGNKPSFGTLAVIGNRDGVVGIGYGKSKDTVPARVKALRNAKLNVFMIRRGSGSWESNTTEPHSIPFTVEGKCGSIRIKLMPAPKGNGLVIEPNCATVLALAGVKDIWSKASGQTRRTRNLVFALIDALKKLAVYKTTPKGVEATGMIEGPVAEARR
jgi:small subunit ribosomal protein S5